MPDLTHYTGREQGYIKHALIEKYLERFVIKIGSGWDEIIYLDAFAGPWGAKSEDLSDTSFGIALNLLKRGCQTVAQIRKRSPKIRVILIEKDPHAFAKLNQFFKTQPPPGIEITCLEGAFEDQAHTLAEYTKGNSFLFSLIDPKGWAGLSMQVIAPLVKKRPSEVLVNVMTSFIYRFSDLEQCSDSYDAFFGRPEVREIITRTPVAERQDAVVREYCRSLRELCGFKYVSSCVVLQPDKKGIKYFMVFATNNPMGIKVFKEAEAHAASLQDELKYANEFGDQTPLFSCDSMEPVSMELRQKYRSLAFKRVEEHFSDKSVATYEEVFCKAMAMPLVTENELVDFLKFHPNLKLILDGKKRKKPDINKGDRVIKTIT